VRRRRKKEQLRAEAKRERPKGRGVKE